MNKSASGALASCFLPSYDLQRSLGSGLHRVVEDLATIMYPELQGRRALVSGGTSGIGRAMGEALRDAGCEVTVTGRTEEEASAFHQHVSGVEALAVDVCDNRAVCDLAERFEELDVLINCAGIILRDGREHDPRQFAEVIDVNLNGMMRMCAAFREKLVESRGCVVNTASMLSFFGSGFVPAYSASKGGVVQLTRSLAIAWAEDQVRVNAIAPGWIETDLTRALRENPERFEQIRQRTPLGRWGRPEEVAGAALFLCSNAARFITGVTLPVDGGYSVM